MVCVLSAAVLVLWAVRLDGDCLLVYFVSLASLSSLSQSIPPPPRTTAVFKRLHRDRKQHTMTTAAHLQTALNHRFACMRVVLLLALRVSQQYIAGYGFLSQKSEEPKEHLLPRII